MTDLEQARKELEKIEERPKRTDGSGEYDEVSGAIWNMEINEKVGEIRCLERSAS